MTSRRSSTAFTLTFTRLIPRSLWPAAEQVKFDAVGVETIDRSEAFVSLAAGAPQTYRDPSTSTASRRRVSSTSLVPRSSSPRPT